MRYNIVISEEAEFQMKEAFLYYEKINLKLAMSFSVELENSIDYITENPIYFQERYRGIRIVLTKKFPYSIHYLFMDKTIFVLKVLHQKQFYK